MIWPRQGQVIGTDEHGNEMSDYINVGNFLITKGNIVLVSQEFAPGSVWKMESLKSPSTTGLVADYYCGITLSPAVCLAAISTLV